MTLHLHLIDAVFLLALGIVGWVMFWFTHRVNKQEREIRKLMEAHFQHLAMQNALQQYLLDRIHRHNRQLHRYIEQHLRPPDPSEDADWWKRQ